MCHAVNLSQLCQIIFLKDILKRQCVYVIALILHELTTNIKKLASDHFICLYYPQNDYKLIGPLKPWGGGAFQYLKTTHHYYQYQWHCMHELFILLSVKSSCTLIVEHYTKSTLVFWQLDWVVIYVSMIELIVLSTQNYIIH